MLTTPLPSCTRMRSAMSSIGSPKNCAPPWLSSVRRPRWMVPIVAVETLPYCVLNFAALSPTCCSIARRSFKSRSSNPLSSAILKTTASTPSWISFSPSMRPRSSGPMSEIVARTGCPALPNTSQKITGHAALSAGSFNCLRRSSTFGLAPPAFARPVRSPLTSAMNTGTPIAEKRCASVCSVTLLPVPVAPVMRPWRFASAGRRWSAVLPLLATRSGAAMPYKIISTMAGHSRWANVKHRKERADSKRGKIFTRLTREITVAARLGGGDPGGNPRLRLAIDKAREQNLPNDNIQRAMQRGAGDLEGAAYEEIRYEGYGPGGAVMVDCMTDNRTRTVAEVRHAFTKNGGNLRADGSVAYLFKHVGQFIFAPGTSEDRVMEEGLDAGAEDVVKNDDDSVELICAPADFPA